MDAAYKLPNKPRESLLAKPMIRKAPPEGFFGFPGGPQTGNLKTKPKP